MQRWVARAMVAAHPASLLIAFAALLAVGRLQWFFADEWDFLVDRSVVDDPGSLLRPHNEHPSLLPILAFRGLFALAGARSYLPYLVVALAVHLGVCHLVWRLARRAGAHSLVATAAAVVLAVFGPGAENILWAFQIGFNGSLLLGLGQVLLVDGNDPRLTRRDLIGQALALGALACSGLGVTTVAVAGLVALLRRGWRAALVAVALPAAVFSVWLLTLGRAGLATHGAAERDLGALATFVWRGLTAPWDRVTATEGVGAAIVVALGIWLLASVVARGVRAAWTVAAASALGSVAMLTLVGFGRTGFGPEFAESSRYLYVVAALQLPAIAAALWDLGALLRQEGARLVAAAVAAAALLWLAYLGGQDLRVQARLQAVAEAESRGLLLAAVEVEPLAVLDVPDRRLSPDVDVDELRALDVAGQLPHVAVTRGNELAALTGMGTSFSATPAFPDAEPVAVQGVRVRGGGEQGGCAEVADGERVELHLDGVASVSVRGDAGHLELYAVDPDGVPASAPRLDPRGVFVDMGPWLNVALPPDLDLWLFARNGGVSVCGVTDDR